MGQALEIAVYRALRQHRHNFVGHFSDLHAHDDRRLYTKVDPPRVISGQPMPGEKLLDFVGFHASGPFGIEVKNIREWIYPNRVEIIDLVQKATAIDAVPVLIARRIHFSTFLVMSRCGVIVHQNFNQVLPATAGAVANRARHKTLLGYHDIRLGNEPDARLQRFFGENLPAVLPQARETFDRFKDLLDAYGNRAIDYTEFAARVRRRTEGRNEDHDFEEVPF